MAQQDHRKGGGVVTLPATGKQDLLQGQAVTALAQTQTHSHKSSPFQLFLSSLLPALNLFFCLETSFPTGVTSLTQPASTEGSNGY